MSQDAPQPRAGVLDIAPYVPGDDRSRAARVFKLSANETPLGPSPRAVEAYRANADTLHVYPDGAASRLREAIGAAYGLNPERIVCGAGSLSKRTWTWPCALIAMARASSGSAMPGITV